MISAPSEMRCMSMPAICISAKTMASVSGIDSATTSPGRTPRLMKLTTRMMATACQQRGHELADGVVDQSGWSATSFGSMPIGRSRVELRPSAP